MPLKYNLEDGIAFMRSFERIYIHPKCVNTISEFSLYSYKVDKYSGQITTQIIDENNHAIDALRYALEPLIKTRASTLGLRLDI
nr:terminase large subunit [uncultured Campylobacter sp.]